MFFVTNNTYKFEEAKQIIPQLQHFSLELPEIQHLEQKEVVRAKIIEAQKNISEAFVVEDTGLYLEALPGLPGPFIKHFLQALGTQGLFKIAEKLESQKAEVRTIVGYHDGTLHFFEGSIRGKIVEPSGKGHGFNSLFQPEGYDMSFEEITQEEKQKISMRSKAFAQLKVFLEK